MKLPLPPRLKTVKKKHNLVKDSLMMPPSRQMSLAYYTILYHIILTLKDIIYKTSETSPKLPWPPTATDLTLDNALDLVPHQLFNFVAWASGISTQQSDNECVEVTLEDNRQIVCTCQDLITLTTKGWWLMPKQCSLTIAVRHMTGSEQLIGLLNGLGHCSSNSLVLEHDTALAHLQMERGEIYIPENIRVELPATLVRDNNDFGKETLSAKGTTHNINGIIIQQAMASDAAFLPSTLSRQRTRARYVLPPPLNLSTYTTHWSTEFAQSRYPAGQVQRCPNHWKEN